jgi:myo-inositol-1(or 4)-monophosphatase
MTDLSNQRLVQLEILCKEVGKFIKLQQSQVKAADIEVKSLNSLVSYVDKTAEEMLVKGLRKIYPEAGFITEEDTVDEKSAKANWIVDPLDGTTNYLHGIPIFAISVALQVGKELKLGVVYELGQEEMFSAVAGQGAKLNGVPIRVNPENEMHKALFATGFPYHDFGRMEAFNELLNYFYRNSQGLRRLGSAATDLAYVACGRFSGFFEYGLSPWDVAAGALLVKEAGGSVHDFKGGENYLFGSDICAGSEAIYSAFSQIIRDKML